MKTLAGLIDMGEAQVAPGFISCAFRLTNYRTLLNLEYYFIGVGAMGGRIIPPGEKMTHRESYMIVRLPQQHIAETFFEQGDDLRKPLYADTRISGYSYLTFRIYFDELPDKSIAIDPLSFLNWNRPGFELVVRRNLKKPLFKIVKLTGGGEENYYPLGYAPGADGRYSFDQENFPKAYHGQRDPSPITAIEAPYRLIITPELPDQDFYSFRWEMYLPTDISTCGDQLWTIVLKAEKNMGVVVKKIRRGKEIKDVVRHRVPLRDSAVEQDGDALMKLMILSSPEEVTPGSRWRDKDSVFLKKVSPESRTMEELVRLAYFDNIKTRIAARTGFLSFSPLGISTAISFNNIFHEKLMKAGLASPIHLFSWAQQISYGRDQLVEETEMLTESIHGLKFLLVNKTNRITYKQSAILLKRYYLRPHIFLRDYTLYESEGNKTAYSRPNSKFNTPFKEIKLNDVKDRQIMEPASDTSGRVAGAGSEWTAFWAVKPDSTFLEWEATFTSWDDSTFIQPIRLFLIRDTLGSASVAASVSIDLKPMEDLRDHIRSQSVKNTDGSLLGFEDLQSGIKNQILLAAADTWVKIQQKGQQFLLDQLDVYKRYLEELLIELELSIGQAAGHISDQVLEEYAGFKRTVMDLRYDVRTEITENMLRANEVASQLLLTIANALTPGQLRSTVIAFRNELLGVGGQIKQLGDDLAGKLDKSLELEETVLYDILALAERYKEMCKITLQEARRAIGTLGEEQTAALKEKVQQLDGQLAFWDNYYTDKRKQFERAYENFITQLPVKLANKLKNTLGVRKEDLKNVLHEIHRLEGNYKSRINMQKAKVSYAVHEIVADIAYLEAKARDAAADAKALYESFKKEFDKANAEISRLETDFILLGNNLRSRVEQRIGREGVDKILDIFNEYPCFPQLHTAQVYIAKVNEMVNTDIPLKIKYAEDYINNQADDFILNVTDNVSRVFAAVQSDGRELLKSAVRTISNEMGGLALMEMAAGYITYAKDLREEAAATLNNIRDDAEEVVNEIKDTVRNNINEIKGELQESAAALKDGLALTQQEYDLLIKRTRNNIMLIGKEAKDALQAGVHEAENWAKTKAADYFKGLETKILGSIHLRDILGDGFELPKLDRRNNKLYYQFITEKIKDVRLGPFSFIPEAGKRKSRLVIYFEKPLNNPKEFTAWTRLEDFTVGIFEERLTVEFAKLEVISNKDVRNKVNVKIDDVHFNKELAFLESLSKNIQIPGTGIVLNISPREISAGLSYAVPGISGGAFTFNNLKFNIGVSIPMPIGGRSEPIAASFGINAPDDKFVVAAGIWGGRGHFVLEATPKYIRKIDTGIDFGGYLALDLGIARGEAFLMAGIRYVYIRSEMGESRMRFYAILSCGGSVAVFGFITISVLFMLCLEYEQYQGQSTLNGTASVTYSVSVGFFKKSFTLSYTKRLAGSQGNSVGEGLTATEYTAGEYRIWQAAYIIDDEGALAPGTYPERPSKRRKEKKLRKSYTPDIWERYWHSFNINSK